MKHAFSKGVLSSKVLACLMAVGLLFATGQTLAALTPAGTTITNEATVTYEDAVGNTYTAQSNAAVVRVGSVYAATLGVDGNRNGAAGQTIYFVHTLTNTGNDTDVFNIAGLDAPGGTQTYAVYHDLNGNGQPGAGEPNVAGGTITLNAGQSAQLVLALPVPAGAAPGSTHEATLHVTSANITSNGGQVEDITDATGGKDDLQETNTDTVTVVSGAVLVPSKSHSFDPGDPNDPDDFGTITYTLQVTNNGGTPATNVQIFDAIPAGTRFVDNSVTVSGLLGSNGDRFLDSSGASTTVSGNSYTDAASLAQLDEAAIGLDLNGDGNVSTVQGILFTDASLAANATVSVSFKVELDQSYDPATNSWALSAGSPIRNTFYVTTTDNPEDAEDPTKLTTPESSNTVTTTVPTQRGVEASDTGDAADEDEELNDIATRKSAAAGETVTFANIIRNTGNGPDTFELAILNDGGDAHPDVSVPGAKPFPPGTLFEYWNADNTVKLNNSNGLQGDDTGQIAAGGQMRITVRAYLPGGVHGTGPYVATLRARSASDNNVVDFKLEHLGEINAPSVDLANTWSPDLTNPSTNEDAFDDNNPITTVAAAVGGIAEFDLFVANNSGNPQSFLLGSETLPAGWSVTFVETGIDTNGDGTLDSTSGAGTAVTSTPSLPAGAVYVYKARVQLSSVVSQALANYAGAGAVNGNYPVIFTVVSSSNASISDKKLDAVDVIADRDLALTPNGSNQVLAGGNVDYSHVLQNQGNTTEAITLTASNSLAGWSNVTAVFVVTSTVDGGLDGTWVQLENLPTENGIVVRGLDGTGTEVTIDIDNSGTDPVLTLKPGQRIELQATVYAPSNAPQGAVDTLTLKGDAGGVTATATDQTQVVTGQVRLDKQAAIQPSCECGDTPATWPTTGFAAEPTDRVKPGECVVWQLTAHNEGTIEALSLEITDETTPYTTFVAAADVVKSEGTPPADPSATVQGNVLTWQADALPSGANARAAFCVRVDD